MRTKAALVARYYTTRGFTEVSLSRQHELSVKKLVHPKTSW